MNTSARWFTILFVVIMAVTCLWIIVWVPVNALLDFRLSEAAMDLETSQGRERKQDYEYAQVSETLPLTQQELAEAGPRAELLLEEVTELKARRKELRAEKKRLEELLDASKQEGDTPVTKDGKHE